jgi:hypothetical protein
MHEYLKAARDGAAKRLKQISSGEPHTKVDSSSWSPPEMLEANKQTGMRPVSPRQYKSGGKVEGAMCGKRADRKARKSGGKVGAMPPVDRYINRDLKKANDLRDGTKHVGGMKKGGRIKRAEGGDTSSDDIAKLIRQDEIEQGMKGRGLPERVPMPSRRPATAPEKPYTGPKPTSNPNYGYKKGGKAAHPDVAEDKALIRKMVKPSARTGKKKGGEAGRDLYVRKGYPHEVPGADGGRIAKKRGGGIKKKGGKTNVNVIIHPHSAGANTPLPPIAGPAIPPPPPPRPQMPPMAGAQMPMGAPIGAMGGGMPAMGAARPGMPPIARRSGGKVENNPKPRHIIDHAAGGGLGRIEKIDAYGLD